MVWINPESRRKYWATRSSVRSFARTAHSFACSRLLASLAPSAALTRLLARSLRSLPRSWESEFLMSQNDLVLSHSALLAILLHCIQSAVSFAAHHFSASFRTLKPHSAPHVDASLPVRHCQCVIVGASLPARPCQCVIAGALSPTRQCRRVISGESLSVRYCRCAALGFPTSLIIIQLQLDCGSR